jgi:hypothetical protein
LKIAGLLLLIGSAFLPAYVPHPAPLITKAADIRQFYCGRGERAAVQLAKGAAVGMAGVMALYLLANVAYLKVMGVPQIAATERVGAALAQLTLGSIGATIVSLTVLLSIVGAINGCIMTAAAHSVCAKARRSLISQIRQNSSAFLDAFACDRDPGHLDWNPGPQRVI